MPPQSMEIFVPLPQACIGAGKVVRIGLQGSVSPMLFSSI